MTILHDMFMALGHNLNTFTQSNFSLACYFLWKKSFECKALINTRLSFLCVHKHFVIIFLLVFFYHSDTNIHFVQLNFEKENRIACLSIQDWISTNRFTCDNFLTPFKLFARWLSEILLAAISNVIM